MPSSSDSLEQESQGGTQKPLSWSQTHSKNMVAAFSGLPCRRGWRNSGLSGKQLPLSLGFPQPQFCSAPAPCRASSCLSASVPSTGSFPALAFMQHCWSLIPPSHGHERLSRGCHKLHRADTDCTPGQCFPYAFICNLTGLLYRHCALVFQTRLDFCFFCITQ